MLEEQGVEVRIKTSTPIDHEDYFSKIDTVEKAYWLGFLCADGNVSKDGKYFQVKLHSRDEPHLKKLSSVIGYHGKIHKYPAVTNYGSYEFVVLQVRSEQMNRDLVRHGCIPNKTVWLDPPLGVPRGLHPHFIRGMVDGDGSLVRRGTVVKGFKMYGVQRIVRWAAEVFPGGRVRQHSGQTWESQWNGIEKVKRLYDQSTELSRMDRKYDIVREILT